MNNIEVAILNEAHSNPVGMMMFLAQLTQKGHNISNMGTLLDMYQKCVDKDEYRTAGDVVKLPHGTIKRFAPITIAIVGASRRFLAQARTNQVGLDYVSASLQYSDYSGKGDFVVPYELLNPDIEMIKDEYLKSCEKSMETYENLVKYGVSNDTAGYAAPQSLRNILIMQGNHESWNYFIRLRSCHRNTEETKYVAMLIWEILEKYSKGGDDMFLYAGPDCVYGKCREGKMSCKKPFQHCDPEQLIKEFWPLVRR